jgi:hypothetical protein
MAALSSPAAAAAVSSPTFEDYAIEDALADRLVQILCAAEAKPLIIGKTGSADDETATKKKNQGVTYKKEALPKVCFVAYFLFIAMQSIPHQLPTPFFQQINHGGHTYTAKNYNKRSYQLDCMHKRARKCPAQYSFPVHHITGEIDLTKGKKIKEHSDDCIRKSQNDLARLLPSAQTLTTQCSVPSDATIEMHVLAEELALAKSGARPEIIYWEIKQKMDEKYVSNWYGMQEGEVKNLIKNTRSKCGYGSYIKTIDR